MPFEKKYVAGVGLEGVAFLKLAAAARDMYFGLANFYVEELGGGLFQDQVVGFAGVTGGKAVGDNRGRILSIFRLGRL